MKKSRAQLYLMIGLEINGCILVRNVKSDNRSASLSQGVPKTGLTVVKLKRLCTRETVSKTNEYKVRSLVELSTLPYVALLFWCRTSRYYHSN